ncbi:DUF488 family protein [uncultured Desulfovibrio sp.]|uniref:DUF488 family protein, N3 subclade n=1 Tax=uncultured Desulfovibrio sp. TaxID=167968 RepID=UPI0026DB7FF8|nr:DUF488 family protein [uncultured Desulfovibrio sp.]
MIQTSFFASKAPRERKVAIAKYPPKYWNGARAPKLAPSDHKAADFATAYRRDLDDRFPTESSLRLYLQEVERETPDPILCCFEADPNECHRRVLAAYIKEKLNWDVPEWGSKAPEQASLL